MAIDAASGTPHFRSDDVNEGIPTWDRPKPYTESIENTQGKLGETRNIMPTHKELVEAGLVQMLIFEIMTNVVGTNITHNRTLETKGSATLPKVTIQKALKQIGAEKETEDALNTYGIEHLEEILVMNNKDLMEANMTLSQITSLKQIAMEALEEKMKLYWQWVVRNIQTRNSWQCDEANNYMADTRSETQHTNDAKNQSKCCSTTHTSESTGHEMTGSRDSKCAEQYMIKRMQRSKAKPRN